MGRVFKRRKLEQLATESGLATKNKAIEDARCETDLMYALFRRPETVVPIMLASIMEIVKKINQPDISKSRVFLDAERILCNNNHIDIRIKVFWILFALRREPEIQEVFKAGYLPGNMWKDKANAHFDRFLPAYSKMGECIINDRFGEPDIVMRVHSFITCAEKIYLGK